MTLNYDSLTLKVCGTLCVTHTYTEKILHLHLHLQPVADSDRPSRLSITCLSADSVVLYSALVWHHSTSKAKFCTSQHHSKNKESDGWNVWEWIFRMTPRTQPLTVPSRLEVVGKTSSWAKRQNLKSFWLSSSGSLNNAAIMRHNTHPGWGTSKTQPIASRENTSRPAEISVVEHDKRQTAVCD